MGFFSPLCFAWGFLRPNYCCQPGSTVTGGREAAGESQPRYITVLQDTRALSQGRGERRAPSAARAAQESDFSRSQTFLYEGDGFLQA